MQTIDYFNETKLSYIQIIATLLGSLFPKSRQNVNTITVMKRSKLTKRFHDKPVTQYQ